jgi:hypothetical protein
MPANLPPQYFEAEKRYRLAETAQERLEALKAMLSLMPKHKGTDRLRAELRTKIAKLTQESQKEYAISRKGTGYYVKKEGAGQAVLVGLPNVGKSQLLCALTSASPTVASYPFTTKSPTPGMTSFENVQIQLVDLPPLTDHSAHSWLPNIIRNADVFLLVVDLSADPVAQVEAIGEQLGKFGIKHKRFVISGTKGDLKGTSANYDKLSSFYGGEFPVVSTSAVEGRGLDELREKLFTALGVIRVYTKTPTGKPDFTTPFILKKGDTVDDLAASIHKDLHSRLKYAQVWGSGKFDGQRVRRDYILMDGDVVELHI